MYIYFICAALIASALTAALLFIFIPKLKSMHMGQPISTIGPRWHKSKEGTPTMGGIFFIIPVIIIAILSSLLLSDKIDVAKMWTVLVSSALFGVIGVADDMAKLKKRQNEGLTARQKFILQLVVASAFVAVLSVKGYIDTVIYIPFVGIDIDLGFFYYVVAIILICGIVNSVNLTDGIDGLAASVTAVVLVFFAVCGKIDSNNTVSLLSCVAFGGCVGFLVFNAYPAKVFMGDTGSLFLGGLVVTLAFIYGSPLVILVCGIVYIIETLSVILQVTYFKLSHGKRLFKMAPFHHHLEKCGFSENKIVALAVVITALFSAVAVVFM